MFEFMTSGLRSGLRGRSFQAVFVLGISIIGLAYLSGFFSPRQPQTVALDIGFSGLRFCLVLLNLFWVQELMAREIDRRVILFSLAYPVNRGAFLVGRFAAMLLLSLLAALVLGLLLLLAVLLAGGQYSQEFPVALGLPFWATVLGLTLDAAVVGAFAMCIAALSTVSALPLALGAAFAIAGKALGATIDYLSRGADGDAELLGRYDPAIALIKWVLPDLSRLDWRDWALYRLVPDFTALGWSVLAAVVYGGLLLLIASHLFAKREFS